MTNESVDWFTVLKLEAEAETLTRRGVDPQVTQHTSINYGVSSNMGR